jgi:hypothetical protein
MEINIRSVYKIDARAEIMTILAFGSPSPGDGRLKRNERAPVS